MLVNGGISLCDVGYYHDVGHQQHEEDEENDMCISVGTPSMSGVSLTVDHDAAMWCNQVPPYPVLIRARCMCDVTAGCSWF